MRAAASYLFCVMVMAALSVVAAESQEPDINAAVNSPWTKSCLSEACSVGKGRRSYCGLISEVALVERKAETGTLLHIVLPARINPERAIRITIDRHEPVSATISRCGRLCWADHAAGPELVEQLKQGQTLLLEAVNRDDTPHIVTIALAGFAEAYDGPPKPMPEFKLRIGSQVEMSAAREQQKRVEEERARRCGSSP